MAATTGFPNVQTLQASSAVQVPKVTSIKTLVESSSGLNYFFPSAYTYTTNPYDEAADPNTPDFSLPIIDFSLLTSTSPDQRSKIIQHDLVRICREWGFFILINHGVPESLMNAMMDACNRFVNLPENEKHEFDKGDNMDEMIKYGTSYSNPVSNKVLFWRDFFMVKVYPEFYSPDKPVGFSEVLLEYTRRCREVASEILKAISESLGLEANYIHKAMNMDRSLQLLVANYYPPCPEPERAIGLSHHTDYGLLTLLIQNDSNGLQVEHNGKWLNVNSPSNVFFVNLSDQMQILTNGKYKSVIHRATVNNRATRISIAVPHGPSLDTVIAPAPELCEREGQPPKYIGMNYKEYIQLKKSGIYSKSIFDHIAAQPS